MPRVYERKFDWDEAARLYKSGVSGMELVERFGVTERAIYRALHLLGVEIRSKATSVRPDSLRCVTCHQWKPDDAFARAHDNRARRQRHRQCQTCNTKARYDYRQRHAEAQREYDREYKRRRKAAA